MDIKKVKKVKMSLMEAKSDINDIDKIDYIIKNSGTFIFSQELFETIIKDGFGKDEETVFKYITNQMYDELLEKSNQNTDSLGIWINYENQEFENSIKLETLNDMKKYGNDVDSIFEFIKMSIIN